MTTPEFEAQAQEAAAIYAAEHTGESVGPNKSGLVAMISRGATPQQAADWFAYVVQNAEFADGTPYGSAFNMSLAKNPGEESGFGYGLSPEEWHKQFTVEFVEGETPAMRDAASKSGLTWAQSLELDPFLDFAYAQKVKAHSAGTAAFAADRIAKLEQEVADLKATVAKLEALAKQITSAVPDHE